MNKKYNVPGLIALAAILPAALYAASRYHSTVIVFVHLETAVCLSAFAACSVWLCMTRRTLFPFLAVCATGIAVSIFYIRYACLFLPPLLILCSAKTALSGKTEDKICFFASLAGEIVCAVSAIVKAVKETSYPYAGLDDELRMRVPSFLLLYAAAAGCLLLFNRSFAAVKPQKKNVRGRHPNGTSDGAGDRLPTVYLLAALSAVCAAVCGTVRSNTFIVPAAAIAWVSLFVSLFLCGDPVMKYLSEKRNGRFRLW